ncbi:hypothetical protein [Microbacterium hominis]|uniref:Uncharacterized protein n=1 Tax=Microbacterium hominis TaxID=162426 RepID=A0A7D4TDN2_9MICO|nr:hypothetical protein [Microbacterium hominis]QKJ18240.1 hypothetical protein HQM25_01715 [Microbacterium hominis]
MKMEFRGWSHRQKTHRHQVVEVIPSLTPGRITTTEYLGPKFTSAWRAQGKMSGLSLSGDFLVNFEMENWLLREWIEAYIRESPEEARDFLQEMIDEADDAI